MKILNPLYRAQVLRDRAPAEAGKSWAMFNVALGLEKLGKLGQAKEWYRKAAQAGDADAMDNLLVLLRRAGKVADADVERVICAGVAGGLDELAKIAGVDGDAVGV